MRFRLTDQKHSKPVTLVDTNDCAVRALASACDVPYMDAWEFWASQGRQTGVGTFVERILGRMTERKGGSIWPARKGEPVLGHTVERVDTRPNRTMRRVSSNSWGERHVYHSTLRPTIAQTVETLDPNFNYIVCTNNHAIAVVKGVLVDNSERLCGSRKRVVSVHKFTPAVPAVDLEDEARRRELRLRIEALEARLV